MKYLLLISAMVLLGACSEGDRGKRFSDNYLEQKRNEKAGQTSATCAFDDIDHEASTDTYSTGTEVLITDMLSKYVTELEPLDSFNLSGQVNYASWLESDEDKAKLCTVIDHLRNTDPETLEGDIKKVFFINAYNVLTIELILKNYVALDKGADRDQGEFPDQRSIKNINDLGAKVWDTFSWKIGSQSYTLNQIEKGILIPMGDARVHFAINCASKGCPPLRNEAFTVGNIEAQLDEMSDFFVSSSAYNLFEVFGDYDPESGDNFYELSSIFDWYAIDFEDDLSGRYGSVRAFIVHHLKTSDEDLGFPKVDLLNEEYWVEEFAGYDWGLNEAGD